MAVAEFLQSTWRANANSGATPSGPSLQAVYTTSQATDGFSCTITIGNKVRSQSSGCPTKKAAKQAAAKSLLSLSSDPSGDEGGGGETKAASEPNGDIAEFPSHPAEDAAEIGAATTVSPTTKCAEQARSCIVILNEFTQKQGVTAPQYSFNAQDAQGQFTCTVVVGGNESGRSKQCRNKKEAKNEAAVDACRTLQLIGVAFDGETKEETTVETTEVHETMEETSISTGNAAAKNCIVLLNEHAQKLCVMPVQYAYQALSAQGPFIAVVTTREGEVGRSEQCRNKKEAKLAAAVDACRKLQLLL